MKLHAAALALACLVFPALAQREAAPLAEDPRVEKRLIEIASELRCLVCQNESLASSQAPLAQDLRREVRELIEQERSDKEIKEFLVSRYGDFVLYRPEFKPATWVLWLGPFVLLCVGLFALVRFLKKRSAVVEAPLSEEQRKRAEALLKDPKG